MPIKKYILKKKKTTLNCTRQVGTDNREIVPEAAFKSTRQSKSTRRGIETKCK